MRKYIWILLLGVILIISLLNGYEKEGNITGEDLGTWVIDSYVNYKEEETSPKFLNLCLTFT